MNFSQARPRVIEGHFKEKVLPLQLPNLGKPRQGLAGLTNGGAPELKVQRLEQLQGLRNY